MILTLEYETRDGLPRSLSVRPHETATFGSTRRADVVIEGDRNIAEIHFGICRENGTWIIEAIPGVPLQLNGKITPRGTLQHRDVIRAGGTDLRVTLRTPGFEGMPMEAPSPPEAQPEEDTPPPPPLEISIHALPSGIVEGKVHGGVERLLEVSNGLQRGVLRNQYRGYFLWNQRRFGDADLADVWESDGANLIQHAPEMFHGTDSLAIGPYIPSDASIGEIVKVMGRDAGVFLISPLEQKDLCEGLKIAWGWYMRPSVLLHQLRHGSDHLASILLQGIAAAIVVPVASQDLVFFGKKESLEPLLGELSLGRGETTEHTG